MNQIAAFGRDLTGSLNRMRSIDQVPILWLYFI